MILFGIIVVTIASVGCVFAFSIYHLIFLRFIQGFGTGSIIVSARSVLTDVFKGRNLAEKTSIVTLGIPIFLAIGPAIGGHLQELFSWQSVFIFLIGYFFIVLCSTYLFKETLQKPTEHTTIEIIAPYRCFFRKPAFILLAFSFTIPNMSWFAYYAASPYLFQDLLNLTPVQYGNLAFYTGGIIVLSSILNIQLVKKIKLTTLIAIGNSTILFAAVLLCLFTLQGNTSFWYMFTPCMIFFISAPFAMSNSIALAMMQVSRNFGSANALISTMQLLGASLATFIFSFIDETSFIPLALFFFILGILNCILLFFVKRLELRLS